MGGEMRNIFISVFIVCLFFIDNAMAGVGSALLRGVVKHFQPRTGEQMVKSLENLEKNLWGKSLGELSESDIKQLMKSGFDPEKIIKDMEKFKREILPEGIGVFLPEEGRHVLVKLIIECQNILILRFF